MMPARTFRDLIVWQKAHQLTLAIYTMTRSFPREELYGLTSQMRRAGVSIPANIVEGFRRRSRTEKARFMNIAQGSLEELRYYLVLSHDLRYTPDMRLETCLDEVGRLLDAYGRTLLARSS